MSHWLLDAATLNQPVKINASLGEFHLRDGTGPLVCVAGGSGQAPFAFIPVLSEEPADSDWTGARGWVTEALTAEITAANAQGYLCGPPPMIDACIGVMSANGMAPEAIYFDKFADQSAGR